MGQGIKTTVIGGLVFLVPVAFLILVLGQALGIAMKVAEPISKIVPIESFAGIALANLIALVLLLIVCYLAGLVARSSRVTRRIDHLDTVMTRAIPWYQLTKRSLSASLDNREIVDDWVPVLIGRPGEKRAIGFEIERLATGDVVVFQPNSPNTESGTVWTVPSEQVEPMKIASRDLNTRLRIFGSGLASHKPEIEP